MLEEIRHIDYEELKGDLELRTALYTVLNVNERLTSKISDLEIPVQALRDEISRLKGGNAKPEFKKAEEKKDWSSGGKEKEGGGSRSARPAAAKGIS